MPADTSHAVVILAAGASRRLGQPKQRLRRQGEPLLARTLRIAAATRPRKRVVVVAAGESGLPDPADAPDLQIVEVPARGALSTSLKAGLAALQDVDSALLLPCDLPRLEAAALERLLALASPSPLGIAVTRHGERPGIPAVIPAPFSAWMAELAGDRGLQEALARLPAQQIGWLDAPELGADIDTPEQLAAARAAGWLDGLG